MNENDLKKRYFFLQSHRGKRWSCIGSRGKIFKKFDIELCGCKYPKPLCNKIKVVLSILQAQVMPVLNIRIYLNSTLDIKVLL